MRAGTDISGGVRMGGRRAVGSHGSKALKGARGATRHLQTGAPHWTRRMLAALAGGLGVLLAVPACAPALAAASPRGALAPALTLAPTLSVVGQSVAAEIAKTVVPRGDRLTKITLRWGDGSKAVTVPSLSAVPRHAYQRAGVFSVVVTMTDVRGHVASARRTESVTLPPGSYSGAVGNTNDPLDFYVSSSKRAVQTVYLGQIALACQPGGSVNPVGLTVDSMPLRSNGSFSATTLEYGAVSGHATTYQIALEGRFASLHAGKTVVSGTVLVTASYVDGSTYHCTSAPALPWAAARDIPQTATSGLPLAGSYSGAEIGTNDPVDFYVANSRSALQNVTVGQLALGCTPGGSAHPTNISVDSVPLHGDGSFSDTVQERSYYDGSPATYSITLIGFAQGLDSQGRARIAGSVVETLTYSVSGTAYGCTSGPQVPWAATRDTVQTVTTSAPQAGSYKGAVDGTNDAVAFTVPSDSGSVQSASLFQADLTCSPSHSVVLSSVALPTETIQNGSFEKTSVEKGTYLGHSATYSITFNGTFHGLDKSGVARAAGSITETLSYSASGTAYACSTGAVPWYVTHTS